MLCTRKFLMSSATPNVSWHSNNQEQVLVSCAFLKSIQAMDMFVWCLLRWFQAVSSMIRQCLDPWKLFMHGFYFTLGSISSCARKAYVSGALLPVNLFQIVFRNAVGRRFPTIFPLLLSFSVSVAPPPTHHPRLVCTHPFLLSLVFSGF